MPADSTPWLTAMTLALRRGQKSDCRLNEELAIPSIDNLKIMLSRLLPCTVLIPTYSRSTLYG